MTAAVCCIKKSVSKRITALSVCWGKSVSLKRETDHSQQTDYAVIRLETDVFIQQTPGVCCIKISVYKRTIVWSVSEE